MRFPTRSRKKATVKATFCCGIIVTRNRHLLILRASLSRRKKRRRRFSQSVHAEKDLAIAQRSALLRGASMKSVRFSSRKTKIRCKCLLRENTVRACPNPTRLLPLPIYASRKQTDIVANGSQHPRPVFLTPSGNFFSDCSIARRFLRPQQRANFAVGLKSQDVSRISELKAIRIGTVILPMALKRQSESLLAKSALSRP